MLTRAIQQTNNPQDWLPVGQFVRAPSDHERISMGGFYLPTIYTETGSYQPRDGVIAEHLSGGGVAVKFNGYKNTVDYSASEAKRFTRCA